MFWLAEQAKQQEVWIVSSYSSPGMEEGVVLKPLSVEIFPTVRVHSKKALPAERQIGQRRMEFVALEPSVGSPPTLHKHLDGGPLALRGPWGPLRSVVLPDGTRTQGQWCREGSGIVGPVPRTGKRVFMRILCSSGRAEKEQRIRVVPPWGTSDEALLTVSSEAAEQVLWFDAPAPGLSQLTGTYRFYAEHPYDPAQEGLRGYASDLGALLCTVEMEEASGD